MKAICGTAILQWREKTPITNKQLQSNGLYYKDSNRVRFISKKERG